MKVRCCLIKQDTPTVNGRIYTQEVLEKIVADTLKPAKERRCFFGIGYPASGKLSLKEVAGLITNCQLVDGFLEVEADLLDTPRGKAVKMSLVGGELPSGYTLAPMLMGSYSDGSYINLRDLQVEGWALIDVPESPVTLSPPDAPSGDPEPLAEVVKTSLDRTMIPPANYYTDYPLEALGDEPGKAAPLRRCEVLAWDRDKYVRVRVGTIEAVIKAGYVYQKLSVDPKAWEGLPRQVDEP